MIWKHLETLDEREAQLVSEESAHDSKVPVCCQKTWDCLFGFASASIVLADKELDRGCNDSLRVTEAANRSLDCRG